MVCFTEDALADVTLTLHWEREGCHHTAHQFVEKFNLWRDVLPAGVKTALQGACEGDIIRIPVAAGEVFPAWEDKNRFWIHTNQLRWDRFRGLVGAPAPGRVYPKGFLKGVSGVFSVNQEPFRVLAVAEKRLLVDLNHPLAGFPLTLTVTFHGVWAKTKERGGTCRTIDEMFGFGPGLEARVSGMPTRFYGNGAFARDDMNPDPAFYRERRLVSHIDANAADRLQSLLADVLPTKGRLLDLMTSVDSHLPETCQEMEVTGLGMNKEEMEANPVLSCHVVQDLNETPSLSFAGSTFDVVTCHLSIEYLTDPVAVLQEAIRVLTPEGLLVLSVSDRWFPPKAIRIWSELHPFERLGMMREWVGAASDCAGISTITSLGYARPADDPHRFERSVSDPLFLLVARKGGA